VIFTPKLYYAKCLLIDVFEETFPRKNTERDLRADRAWNY
jgi:hypothetical protein